MKKYLKLIIKITFFFLCFIGVKILIADMYFIPSGSMEYTIKPQSYTLVSKLHYGAKLPRSTHEIPYFSIIFKKFSRIKLWEDTRLFGLSEISRSDIALFEHNGVKLIKRVVGVSGDTIKISNGLLRVNSINEKILDTYMYQYKAELTRNEVDSLKSKVQLVFNGQQSFNMTLNGEMYKELNDKKMMALSTDIDKNNKTYPQTMSESWNMNNYGSIVIPFKGMKIVLDTVNYNLYKQVIRQYEKIKIKKENSKYIVDNEEKEFYVFKNNYFFFMGDNRMNSFDSRFFGFVPKKQIFGKIIYTF